MFLHRHSKMKLELKLFSLKALNCPAARRFSVGSKIKIRKLRSNDVTSTVVYVTQLAKKIKYPARK